MKKILFVALSFFLWLFSSNPQLCLAQINAPSLEYISSVQNQIYSYLIYPQEAFTNGWEGIVTLRFVINADGQVKQVYLVESSGFAVLDQQAIDAVRNAAPYPAPESVTDEIEIVLPLQYALDQELMEPAPVTEQSPATQTEVSFDQPLPNELSLEQLTEEIPQTETVNEYQEPIEENPPPAPVPQAPAEQQQQPAQQQASLPVVEKQSAQQQKNAPVLARPEFKLEDLKVRWPTELSGFIKLALQNNKPSQVAKKEVAGAETKVREATRNLFPSAKVSSYYTEGETFTQPYDEYEIKLEANQPLYTGGKLIHSLEHAKVNLEITRRNYDRIRAEVIHKSETAYYNLVASRTHWKHKQALRDEAKALLDQVDKLQEIGMIIPLEMKNARASFEQIEFHLASLKQDIYLAELTLKQVLNNAELPTIALEEPEVTKPNLDLDELYTVALKNRPEAYVGELMVKFNKLAKWIEHDKDKFQVEAVGSYGYGKSKYEHENWKRYNSWSAGVKVSKFLGANSAKSSLITDKSQPKLGQSSVVKSKTASGEFGILDNFTGITSKQKADVDLDRAVSDLNETKKTIAFEVQDAYLSYQKAILQLNTAEAEMIYRRNQCEITKIKAMVNDAPLSSAMESLYQLSDAQNKYFQALGNYFLALANLKKATGYAINI